MRFEAEVIAEDLLPAVRSILASRLQQDYGFTQEAIASRLDITQPAVSQYLGQTRADQDVIEKLCDDPQVDILLDDITSLIARDQDFANEIGQLVDTVRDKGILKERFDGTRKI